MSNERGSIAGTLIVKVFDPGDSSAGAANSIRVRLQSIAVGVQLTRSDTDLTSTNISPTAIETSEGTRLCGKFATRTKTVDCSWSERPAASRTVGTFSGPLAIISGAKPS